MRLMLDACVLYPTVMREVLLGAAAAGFFEARWSARILEEWALAARKLGPEGEAIARSEVAMVQTRFPGASVVVTPEQVAAQWLPDPDDAHVLAAAVVGSCDGIVTVNAKDFPRNLLADEGLWRSDPDTLLTGFVDASPERMRPVAEAVLTEANRLSPQPWEMRALMKKARLPRFGKALARV